jgi:hypothetical protein
MKDYTGIKSHMLTFIRVTDIAVNRTYKWLLACDCGGIRVARPADVLAGKTQSCGCHQKKAASTAKRKHGGSGTKQYQAWKGMHTRCSNPNSKSYADYGARGITVSPEWKDYQKFVDDMGVRPEGCALDRIDNEKGYSKINCRWVTTAVNNRNKRSNRMITLNGETRSLVEWSEVRGIKMCTVKARLRRGQPVELALAS